MTVDDNRTNLQILQVFLKKLGHEAIPAENGEVAVAKYHEHKPDLILMDIMMPVMDGLEATRQIRAQPSERWVPIIFLSALDRDENLVGGLEAGGDDYLSKPINFVVLEAKMRSMQRTLRLQQGCRVVARLQAISDNVLDAIITIDSEANIVFATILRRAFRLAPANWSDRTSSVCPEPYRIRARHLRSRVREGGPPRILGLDVRYLHSGAMATDFPQPLAVTQVSLEQPAHVHRRHPRYLRAQD